MSNAPVRLRAHFISSILFKTYLAVKRNDKLYHLDDQYDIYTYINSAQLMCLYYFIRWCRTLTFTSKSKHFRSTFSADVDLNKCHEEIRCFFNVAYYAC